MFGMDNGGAESGTDCLVPETNTQDRNASMGVMKSDKISQLTGSMRY